MGGTSNSRTLTDGGLVWAGRSRLQSIEIMTYVTQKMKDDDLTVSAGLCISSSLLLGGSG